MSEFLTDRSRMTIMVLNLIIVYKHADRIKQFTVNWRHYLSMNSTACSGSTCFVSTRESFLQLSKNCKVANCVMKLPTKAT